MSAEADGCRRASRGKVFPLLDCAPQCRGNMLLKRRMGAQQVGEDGSSLLDCTWALIGILNLERTKVIDTSIYK